MVAKNSRRIGRIMCVALALGLFAPSASAQNSDQDSFRLSSTTFSNGATLPISTILNNPMNGVNTCTPDGAVGYDQSPELSWTGTPRDTRSFVVVLYDRTAAFTHWGMYNIRGNATELPENAGVAGSTYGIQVGNDFGLGQEYSGPCPPANVAPDAHLYVFTIYALSTTLALPGSTNFPPDGETLYHALIRAGEQGEILGKANLKSSYSSTPPVN